MIIQHKSGLWIRDDKMDEYVIREQSIYNPLPVEGEIVLDIGGHIGAFARRVIERGARGVYSFEPEPENFSLLKRNSEGFPIDPYLGAIVHHIQPYETLWLNGGKNTGNHSLIQRRGRECIRVNAYNFEQAIETFKPTVIKIDIEGGEYDLKDDLARLPKKVKAIAIELHYVRKEHLEQAKSINEMLSALDFRILKEPKFGKKLWFSLGIWAK